MPGIQLKLDHINPGHAMNSNGNCAMIMSDAKTRDFDKLNVEQETLLN